MIKVRGVRPATVIVKGVTKQIKDYTHFNLWNISEAQALLYFSPSVRCNKYIEFLNNHSINIPQYSDDVLDDSDSMEPVVYAVVNKVNIVKEHIEKFQNWIKYCESEDYVIEFYEEA